MWSPRREIAFHVGAAGYLGVTLLLSQSPSVTTAEWFSTIRLMDEAAAIEAFGQKAGFRVPAPDRAFVEVAMLSGATPSAANVSLSIEPAGGPAPVYAARAGDYDRTLNSATQAGRALFAEVPAGRFELTFTGCTLRSDPGSATWKATKPNALAGLAVAGAVTLLSAACE